MKKHLRMALACMALAMLVTSCKKYLEETPYNSITPGNLYNTKEGITNGINGLYAKLRAIYAPENMFYLCEGPSDLWLAGVGAAPAFLQWNIDANTNDIRQLWNSSYESINQANSVIDALENVEITNLDDSLKNRYLAEARFIRAHFYYHVVQQYGDPYFTTTPAEGVQTTATRTPAAQVWQFVIDELEFAAANLPEQYDAAEYGHATKYAALHHLARVYLTVKRDNNDLQKARAAADQVINSGRYSLMPSHADLFRLSNERNSEVLFSVLYSKTPELNGNGNESHLFFTCAYSEEHPGVQRVTEYGRPYSRLRPSWYYQNLFNGDIDQRWDDDFRTSWNITVDETTTDMYNPNTNAAETVAWKKGQRAMFIPKTLIDIDSVKALWPVYVFLPDSMRNEINPETDIQPNGPWPSNTRFQNPKLFANLIKFQDQERPDVNTTQGSRDYFIFRLADTYLLAGEAAFLLGDPSAAAGYINKVRERAAKEGSQGAMDITPEQVSINFILDERARELGGEMFRWYDLLRTGKLMEQMTNPNINPVVAPKFKDYMKLRPIPRDQLTRMSNPADFPQNPGYGN
ncbi:RagB/SusD family nutrient uptake outer membrane protein [Foetidibacter luteolus]|uniref:RagB/SusD family nutrient uptake outer membrane protein n=1 Tax=Foetidibacter luteolus TaxID=2608880 RepID=UPI00129BEF37|nr:RagB/SusD family nutrient uptake outer membrane protein [Foetidibacter luteolus]